MPVEVASGTVGVLGRSRVGVPGQDLPFRGDRVMAQALPAANTASQLEPIDAGPAPFVAARPQAAERRAFPQAA